MLKGLDIETGLVSLIEGNSKECMVVRRKRYMLEERAKAILYHSEH